MMDGGEHRMGEPHSRSREKDTQALLCCVEYGYSDWGDAGLSYRTLIAPMIERKARGHGAETSLRLVQCTQHC